jgi:hypothetical protein
MRPGSLAEHRRHQGSSRRIMMQYHPMIAMDAEDAYRRERAAEEFHRTGGRSRRLSRTLVDRLPWHRRRDRVTD